MDEKKEEKDKREEKGTGPNPTPKRMNKEEFPPLPAPRRVVEYKTVSEMETDGFQIVFKKRKTTIQMDMEREDEKINKEENSLPNLQKGEGKPHLIK